MDDYLKVFNDSYSITKAELHLPVIDDARMFYMGVYAKNGGFHLWEFEVTGLEKVDDLDGKRLHVHSNGEAFDDDSLGTDIIGAFDTTDLNYVSVQDSAYCYGEIHVDFARIDGLTYRCHVELKLTESDEDPEDLTPEDCNIECTADFTVLVDEKNPFED